jgi:glycosyltransferase involved in cell wall biosynthesis
MMSAMCKASIIICAHNPRPNYLQRVLSALRNQTLSTAHWELLLVDNASEVPLAPQWDLSWHPNARHIVENELGVAITRRRGMMEASTDLLIFVDDDNVLDNNYLLEAVRIKHEWPQLGVWGSGAIVPEFEVAPQPYVAKLLSYLALREMTKPQWSNVFPCIQATPWGAGMCLRSHVAAAYRQWCEKSVIHIASRRGKKVLLSGEDIEMCYVACEYGNGMGTFPQLRLTHLIPKERVTVKYLLKVFEGTAISNLLLAYKWEGRLPNRPLRPRGLLSISKSLLTQQGIDRRMYLANVRAEVTAGRIIAASQSNKSSTRGTQARIVDDLN